MGGGGRMDPASHLRPSFPPEITIIFNMTSYSEQQAELVKQLAIKEQNAMPGFTPETYKKYGMLNEIIHGPNAPLDDPPARTPSARPSSRRHVLPKGTIKCTGKTSKDTPCRIRAVKGSNPVLCEDHGGVLPAPVHPPPLVPAVTATATATATPTPQTHPVPAPNPPPPLPPIDPFELSDEEFAANYDSRTPQERQEDQEMFDALFPPEFFDEEPNQRVVVPTPLAPTPTHQKPAVRLPSTMRHTPPPPPPPRRPPVNHKRHAPAITQESHRMGQGARNRANKKKKQEEAMASGPTIVTDEMGYMMNYYPSNVVIEELS